MVGKSQIKFIKSLYQKKYRILNGLFVAEGIKMVDELLQAGFEPHKLYVTETDALLNFGYSMEMVSMETLSKMSNLLVPNKVLGVFRIPEPKAIDELDWIVALDDVRDPGNLGTIIRLCDWFGICHLVCSTNTVNCYNPKVLQATMGSIARVNIFYTDLPKFLARAKVPIWGTYMEGTNLYDCKPPSKGILVMGNEAHGISKAVEALVSSKVAIPQFRKKTAESLNVAMATSIFLSEIRRDFF